MKYLSQEERRELCDGAFQEMTDVLNRFKNISCEQFLGHSRMLFIELGARANSMQVCSRSLLIVITFSLRMFCRSSQLWLPNLIVCLPPGQCIRVSMFVRTSRIYCETLIYARRRSTLNSNTCHVSCCDSDTLLQTINLPPSLVSRCAFYPGQTVVTR
jgi:hypothetical protein